MHSESCCESKNAVGLRTASALALIALVGLMAGPMPVGATTLTFGLDVEFSGATEPEGTAPWVTAVFDDSFGGANGVRLTLETNNLTGTEFVALWYFNFDPSLDPTGLTITPDVGNSVDTAFDKGENDFKADGDGSFDIEFDFPPPPGGSAPKFMAGISLIYDISFGSPIDVDSFDFSSVNGGGVGTFLSAAHVQGIGASGDDSGWIGQAAVPEPSTALLLVSGLVGLASYARRRDEPSA